MTDPSEVYGWVSRDGGPWEPVTLQGWIAAERDAGFNAPIGQAATAGFGNTTHGEWYDATWDRSIRGRKTKPQDVG